MLSVQELYDLVKQLEAMGVDMLDEDMMYRELYRMQLGVYSAAQVVQYAHSLYQGAA